MHTYGEAVIELTPERSAAIDREARRRNATNVRIIGEQEVETMTNLSRVTIWRLERTGAFPKRIRLTPGRIGWREDEIISWIESRPRGAA